MCVFDVDEHVIALLWVEDDLEHLEVHFVVPGVVVLIVFRGQVDSCPG